MKVADGNSMASLSSRVVTLEHSCRSLRGEVATLRRENIQMHASLERVMSMMTEQQQQHLMKESAKGAARAGEVAEDLKKKQKIHHHQHLGAPMPPPPPPPPQNLRLQRQEEEPRRRKNEKTKIVPHDNGSFSVLIGGIFRQHKPGCGCQVCTRARRDHSKMVNSNQQHKRNNTTTGGGEQQQHASTADDAKAATAARADYLPLETINDISVGSWVHVNSGKSTRPWYGQVAYRNVATNELGVKWLVSVRNTERALFAFQGGIDNVHLGSIVEASPSLFHEAGSQAVNKLLREPDKNKTYFCFTETCHFGCAHSATEIAGKTPRPPVLTTQRDEYASRLLSTTKRQRVDDYHHSDEDDEDYDGIGTSGNTHDADGVFPSDDEIAAEAVKAAISLASALNNKQRCA